MMMLKPNRAMTLIEVLITIVVFSTGILVILSVVTNGIALGNRSRNRTTATMLAKEGLELMFNIRDTNLDKAQPRGCLPLASTKCDLDISQDNLTYVLTVEGNDGIKVNNVLNNFDATRLYVFTGGGYTSFIHGTTLQPTIFYRYITISPLIIEESDTEFVRTQIKKITSTVEFKQMGGTGKVVLESFIGLTRQ